MRSIPMRVKDMENAASKASRIDTKLLIPGKGEPIEHASLVYEDGTIVFVGPTKDLPAEYDSLRATKVPVLMPGMWDVHVHYLGSASSSLENAIWIPLALAGARTARDLAATLNAGFTSVRECGGWGADISPALTEGWLRGPNVYSVGSVLSMCGGHADAHSIPLNAVERQIHDMNGPFMHCDGVPECLKAVRTQLRRGARCIKVCASGGVLSLVDSPFAPEFSLEELKAICEEAERGFLTVAAHCHGTRGILNAIKAGVKSIEHGSFLTDECIKLMKEKDVYLVPTRTIVEWGLSNSDALAPESRKKMNQVAAAGDESYKAAIKSGVNIALGTDIGFSSEKLGLQHGTNGREFVLAVKAGMTPLQAIEAGTASAPNVLGPQAPKAGQLKVGYDADFIALASSPLDDIHVLEHPEKVTHVWKAGVLEKEPGRPVGAF